MLNNLIDKFAEYHNDEQFDRVLEEAVRLTELNVETYFPPINTISLGRKPTQNQIQWRVFLEF